MFFGRFFGFWDFLKNLDFFKFFGIFFLLLLLMLLLKVTKVITGDQKMPKMGQNSIISSFFARKKKSWPKAEAPRRS